MFFVKAATETDGEGEGRAAIMCAEEVGREGKNKEGNEGKRGGRKRVEGM